jgi:parallel beta-helix repeat protein
MQEKEKDEKMNKWSVFLKLVLLSLLAACGPAAPTATPLPTAIPTPPPAPTPVPTPTAAPTSVPMTIQLQADGSGDFATLAEAVQNAPDGATIHLAAGEYRLEGPLDIDRPLQLVGEGMTESTIMSNAEGFAVRYRGEGLFGAQDLTFRHVGSAPAHTMVVDGGEVALARCRFTGSIEGEELWTGGVGLLLSEASGQVEECLADSNGMAGIVFAAGAAITLEDNIIRNNQYNLVYFDDAGGVARGNQVLGGMDGILVTDQAQPTLEENACQDNSEAGIVYLGTSGGLARGNDCTENVIGVIVSEQAQPTLEGNLCGGNNYGIVIDGQAQPTLEGNRCLDVDLDGITYAGSAGGVARNNECTMGVTGIKLTEQAQPLLEGNISTGNYTYGIAYLDTSGGIARGNECSGNEVGLYVKRSSTVELVDNDCHDNDEDDLLDLRTFPLPAGWTLYNMANGLGGNLIMDVAAAPDGSIWVATLSEPGVGAGVARWDGAGWTTFTEADGLAEDFVQEIAFTPDGVVWFGTNESGVSRFDPAVAETGAAWTTYTRADGLAEDNIRAIAVAPDGALWIGTQTAGISHFDGESWTNYTEADGLIGSWIRDIAVAPDGTAWAGCSGGVSFYTGSNWVGFADIVEAAVSGVQSIAIAPDGSVWFGQISYGAARYDPTLYVLDPDAWTFYGSFDVLTGDLVFDIAVAPDRSLWFGTDAGVSHYDGMEWTSYTEQDGLVDNEIRSIAVAPDGSLWFATRAGVMRYQPGG